MSRSLTSALHACSAKLAPFARPLVARPLFPLALLVLVGPVLSACMPPRLAETVSGTEVHAIRIDATNVGVLSTGQDTLLIDIGFDGAYDKLVVELEARKIAPDTVSTLILTHGHPDHAADAARVQATGVALWAHAGDAEMLRTGVVAETGVYGAEAHALAPFVMADFTPSEPDVLFDRAVRFEQHGAVVYPVGGHTDGSVVVVVHEQVAFVGDLVRGGVLGGMIAGETPMLHLYHDDVNASHDALRALLEAHPHVHTFWPAHGEAFSRATLQAFLDEIGTL